MALREDNALIISTIDSSYLMTLNSLTMSSTFCVTAMEDQEIEPSPGLPWVKVGSRPPTLNYIQIHNYLILSTLM